MAFLRGIPSLEKALRENKNDTGKTDAYAHTGTASAGDTIDYQIISTLPSITSESTYLSCYTFVDTLSKGLTYNKGDVVLEFFTDSACTDSVAKWTEADGKFAMSIYNPGTRLGLIHALLEMRTYSASIDGFYLGYHAAVAILEEIEPYSFPTLKLERNILCMEHRLGYITTYETP